MMMPSLTVRKKVSFRLHLVKQKQPKSASDRVCDLIGKLIPNCADGLRLVELGQKRPLKLSERFALFYNSPLCLHCNCNRQKFDKEREKLREIERGRCKLRKQS